MTLRSIHNRHNFFSDYWLGTLLSARGGAGQRLSAAELRRRMGRVERLGDALGGAERVEPARFRERFARPLLGDVFDFALGDEPLPAHPQAYALRAAGAEPGAPPLAVVLLCGDAGELDGRAARGALDKALSAAGLDHGLLLSPRTLRLVRRAGDGARQGALDLSLATLRAHRDADSLQAAHRLLSAAAFTPDASGRRPLDALEAESRAHAARVSSALKEAVFEAAERIVAAFQQDVAARPGAFADLTGDPHDVDGADAPAPTSLAAVRDAGFLALYRLLFVLYAESRDERLQHHALYCESYGLGTLVDTLLHTPEDRLAANRTRHWARVQALFRVFDEGLAPGLPHLETIPPRGGGLFSASTPAGRLLARLQLDDRACAAVLLALATTAPRRGVGRERVSFRELEIEQLGAVYEGLLEYEPAVADGVRLEVHVGGRELALTPEELAFLCDHKRLHLAGDPALVAGTAAERLHPDASAADDEESDEDDEDEASSDDGDEPEAVRTGAPIRLVRRLEPGTFYFRPGGARKASGSYYTPTPMVDFLVREALGPLVAGRSAAGVEALRVVDLACGSAHFLVGAARFLGARLHEAYRAEHGDAPPPAFAPAGGGGAVAAGRLRDRWAAEGAAWCKRRVVERCLYGVDLNPAAVQLAQVALWIESLAGDRPLSFFAHHVRVGNALQGTFADRFDTAPDPQLVTARRDAQALGLFESSIRQRIEAALGERRLIDAELPPEVRPDSAEEFRYKADRLRRSEAALGTARLLMDLRSAAPYVPAVWPALAELSQVADPGPAARARPWWDAFERVRARERFFHWELEFPEVLLRNERPGFDAVLGNPPWDKVLPNEREFYASADPLVLALKGAELKARMRQLDRERAGLAEEFAKARERTTTFARVLRRGGDFPLAKPEAESDGEDGVLRTRKKNDQNAHEDLAKYCVDRSLRLARDGGAVGLVIPSVVYNGDGCVGIRQFLFDRAQVTAFYGFENRRRIFPIDSRYKFAALAARKGAGGTGAFEAAFMRHDVAELAADGPRPWAVCVTRAEVERLSPATLALLEFRGPRDQAVVRRMSEGRPTLGGDGAGAWGTRLVSWRQHEVIFNATDDKDLFTDRATGRLHTPASVLGAGAPEEPEALLAAMRQAGFSPVYEGKHVEQYLVGLKPLRWWLSVAQAEAKYGRSPREAPTLVFRETASNTNQRTCIAAVLPAGAVGSHKLTGVRVEQVAPEAALAVLNSLCFDYLLRLRSAGTNVSFTYILPVAVPPAAVTNALPRVATRFAPTAGVAHVGDDPAVWPALWAADRAVAEAYGLGAEDFAHVLGTFPVWQRKRARLAGFYQARLAEWAAEGR